MADKKISLVLGSHAHVPYGADAEEFENVYKHSLKPFISCLYKYPKIQATLHYSGVLLYWIERSHPELFMLLEDMVSRKQVEMLGGGFYEPMLPIIPLQDKIGQIELLTTYLRKQFGKRPQGCWIPRFAWEQNLVSPLVACGMGFIFLSDRQFVLAGGGATPCICEDQGKIITVFPVSRSLEDALHSKSISGLLTAVQENIDGIYQEGNEAVISIFPEKISDKADELPDISWYRFFEDLSQCEGFVETVNPGRLFKSLKGLQKLSFSDLAGAEDAVSPRRFIINNPEAGRIYSKMIFTNMLIGQLRGDKSRKLSAHKELWKAQGSAHFCHTGKHGLHSHLLRNAAYNALLEAERVTREKGKFVPSLVSFDFDMDGTEEWLFQDVKINSYVQSIGGGIFELDYLPKAWNYLDTCQGRIAFADRLLPAEVTVKNLAYGTVDGARSCCDERYELVNMDKVRRRLHLALRQSSAVSRKVQVPFGCIEIEKTFLIKKDAVCINYSLVNRGTVKEVFQFSPEIDLSLPGEGDAFVRFFSCKSASGDTPIADSLLHGADGLKIHDIKNEVQITLTATRSFDGRISPVCVSGGTDLELYQAICVMPLLPVSLEGGESWDIEFNLKFSH